MSDLVLGTINGATATTRFAASPEEGSPRFVGDTILILESPFGAAHVDHLTGLQAGGFGANGAGVKGGNSAGPGVMGNSD
jgi:hypothetical protein